MNYWKLGCRWGAKKSGFPLFLDILQNNKIVISWEDKDYGLNTPILLTDGHTAIAYAFTISTAKTLDEVPHLKKDFADKKISMEYGLRIYDAEIHLIPKDLQFQYSLVQGICEIQQQDIIDKLAQIIHYTNSMEQLQSKVNVLKYKKQIILQGPPGTGKTKLAKEITEHLIGNVKTYEKPIITNEIISKILYEGLEFNSVGGREIYKIKRINFDKIYVETSGEDRLPTTNGIIKYYQNNLDWNTTSLKGVQSYEMALAKYISENIQKEISSFLSDNEQFKLIQFHPSYTYEDFVRGIVAESKGDKIEYKNVNKTLGLFAEEALKNYRISSQNSIVNNLDIWIDEKFEDFKNEIEKDVEESEINLSGNINLFKVEVDNFRYGKDWASPSRINFSDFKILIKAVLESQLVISLQKIPKELSVHAHYRYTYYNALLKKFFDNYSYNGETYSETRKNYVLIIDEINRANLSSVLGELIYALEYRGENVESMYKVGDSNKLTLPPNLYIIGTMNTADRSVGHIDYAIRRRFAFVDVLPKNLESELKDDFKVDLFAKVASLFIENYDVAIDYSDENVVMKKSEYMTGDFDPKDVWLGHSYFIQHYEKNEIGEDIKEKPVDFRFRIRYEIKPILEEYIKDGILKESARSIINSL